MCPLRTSTPRSHRPLDLQKSMVRSNQAAQLTVHPLFRIPTATTVLVALLLLLLVLPLSLLLSRFQRILRPLPVRLPGQQVLLSREHRLLQPTQELLPGIIIITIITSTRKVQAVRIRSQYQRHDRVQEQAQRSQPPPGETEQEMAASLLVDQGQVQPFCLLQHQPCIGRVPGFMDKSHPRNFVLRLSTLWASLFTSLEAATPRTASTLCTFSMLIPCIGRNQRHSDRSLLLAERILPLLWITSGFTSLAVVMGLIISMRCTCLTQIH